MSKYKLKTTKTKKSVPAYIRSIENEERRRDATTMLELMKKVTREKPVLWGNGIVGFGTYRYKYSSGQEGEWMATGFSSRKQNLTVYIMPGFAQYQELLEKVGTHTHSSSCLYIKKLSDMHLPTLKKLITAGYKDIQKMYPTLH